ncbi:hypothetical protein HWV62_2882 [Athelia sp. TMB]|nr:hypothetical protein HWV62_2882 [Athelia sp. TMB]
MGIYNASEERSQTLKEKLKVRSSLEGVEYVFLDEVSMLSCGDMYRISAAASSALAKSDEAFGGLNMIFAGDFAQLPPVGGSALYCNKVKSSLGGKMTYFEQQEAIGKALWHQTTTVVILRENMRQQVQSEEDQKLRTALENMRYKSCTADDIAYLRTRIAGRGPGRPKIAAKRFRNVSVITGLNLHKDQINTFGSARFARERNEELHMFYSRDLFKSNESDTTSKEVRRKNKQLTDKSRSSNEIPKEMQDEIWDLPSSCTNHIPGKLQLCVGMPVMLRYNDATECCITKGAEANVAYWHSSVGPHGLPMLDTVFVKLKNPASDVQIEGLPINIVPLTRRVDSVPVKLMNGERFTIARHQVPMVLNFAMTDYNSQGRTVRGWDVGACS